MLSPWRSWPETRLDDLSLPLDKSLQQDQDIYLLLLREAVLELSDMTYELEQYQELSRGTNSQFAFHQVCPWFSCANAESLRAIKTSLTEPYDSIPLSSRFEMAMSLQFGLVFDTKCFLQAVGINGVNQMLAELETSSGQNALHFVALQLKYIMAYDPAIQFARDLLQAGADIHKLDKHGCTPLQYFLRSQSQYPSWEPISVWASLLKAAGVDLTTYGQHEMALWQPYEMRVLFNDENVSLSAENIIIGSCPSEWDVLIRETAHTQLYEYKAPPASWPLDAAQASLPSAICWKPDDEDRPSLHWAPTRRIDHGSKCYLASNEHSTLTSDLNIWQRCQDDIGPIALAMAERGRGQNQERRSTSQPPLRRICLHTKTFRQSYSFFRYPNDRTSTYDWLWEYDDHHSHICTLGGPQRLVCSASSEMNPARCLQGFNQRHLLWDAIDRNVQAARRKHVRNVKADMFKLEYSL